MYDLTGENILRRNASPAARKQPRTMRFLAQHICIKCGLTDVYAELLHGLISWMTGDSQSLPRHTSTLPVCRSSLLSQMAFIFMVDEQQQRWRIPTGCLPNCGSNTNLNEAPPQNHRIAQLILESLFRRSSIARSGFGTVNVKRILPNCQSHERSHKSDEYR